MSMVCGLDLHRRPDHLRRRGRSDRRGMAGPVVATGPSRFRRWLTQEVAPEPRGSRWRWRWRAARGGAIVVEEISAAGFEAHLAEPADTQAARGRKRHAKTDRSDARLLRELLAAGDLPESWIPPEMVLGVAGAGAALQVAGRPAHPVDAAHPRRAATITASRCPKAQIRSTGTRAAARPIRL